MREEKLKFSAFVAQALCSVSIAMLACLTGFIYAWPSYTIELFRSNSTVLSAPMSITEASLLGSLTNFGALVATPLCGYTMDKLGRKYTTMLFGFSYVITWTIITFSTSVYLILFAIGLGGFGASGVVVISAYISEICQDSIRGAFTSTTVSGVFFGLLISYTLGGYLQFYHVVYIHLAVAVLYIVILSFLKESPVYYMKINKTEEAKKSLAFYRHVDKESKIVEQAIEKIKLQLNPKLAKNQDGDSEAIKDLLGTSSEKKESAWQILRRSKSSKRALATMLVTVILTILMGSTVMQIYAETLFKEAVPTMNPNTGSISLGVVLLLASVICGFTVDRFGRKPLMITTSVASGVINLLLATQIQFYWAPHWFTALGIYLYSFVYNLGAATIPFVLVAEVFLPEVRGIGNSCSMACMWIMNFIMLMIFNPVVESYGLGPPFYFFSIICFCTAGFSQFYLPETKGLSSDAIQRLFIKTKISKNDSKV